MPKHAVDIAILNGREHQVALEFIETRLYTITKDLFTNKSTWLITTQCFSTKAFNKGTPYKNRRQNVLSSVVDGTFENSMTFSIDVCFLKK